MRARTLASSVRQNFGLSGKIDISEVACNLEVKINLWDLPANEVHEVMVRGSVAVSRDLDEPTRRWAIAHAIGHHLMHSSNHLWLRMETHLNDKLEAEAEQFAYYLLVDEKEARREGLNTAPEIAERFGVPTEMVSRHLTSYWG